MFNWLQGYKTVGFNLVALAVALLQHYGGPLPVVDLEQFNFVVVIVNLILRYATKGPVGSKIGG